MTTPDSVFSKPAAHNRQAEQNTAKLEKYAQELETIIESIQSRPPLRNVYEQVEKCLRRKPSNDTGSLEMMQTLWKSSQQKIDTARTPESIRPVFQRLQIAIMNYLILEGFKLSTITKSKEEQSAQNEVVVRTAKNELEEMQ